MEYCFPQEEVSPYFNQVLAHLAEWCEALQPWKMEANVKSKGIKKTIQEEKKKKRKPYKKKNYQPEFYLDIWFLSLPRPYI